MTSSRSLTAHWKRPTTIFQKGNPYASNRRGKIGDWFRTTEEYGLEKWCRSCPPDDCWWPFSCFTSHPEGAGHLSNDCHDCRNRLRRSRGIVRTK